jgi:hypothetical protein
MPRARASALSTCPTTLPTAGAFLWRARLWQFRCRSMPRCGVLRRQVSWSMACTVEVLLLSWARHGLWCMPLALVAMPMPCQPVWCVQLCAAEAHARACWCSGAVSRRSSLSRGGVCWPADVNGYDDRSTTPLSSSAVQRTQANSHSGSNTHNRRTARPCKHANMQHANCNLHLSTRNSRRRCATSATRIHRESVKKPTRCPTHRLVGRLSTPSPRRDTQQLCHSVAVPTCPSSRSSRSAATPAAVASSACASGLLPAPPPSSARPHARLAAGHLRQEA